MTGPANADEPAVLVWDWPLRLGHWLLALTVAGSWATHYAGLQWFAWHRWCGYTTLVLVLFRIVWGFTGPRHARFADFVRGPGAVIAYLRRAQQEPAAGHTPLGALSVVALLALLLLQAATGLFANDAIANAGPFFGWVAQATSDRLTGWHKANAYLLLGLIVLHLVAVAWYDGWRHAGLSRAMVTGRKRLRVAGAGIDGAQPGRALVIVLVLAAALALAIRLAPEASFSFF